MYDKGKILPGLIIFVGLVTLPFWYTRATGQVDYRPEPKLPELEKQCVEPKDFMRASHMKLLIDWRETVVRSADRTYVASDGKTYNKSLTTTCLSCHAKKAEFCDQCHNYLAVTPYCWDCHSYPKENT